MFRSSSDQHWYDADEMKKLIMHYIINSHPNVDFLCDINVSQREALSYHLSEELNNRVEKISANKNKIDTLIIPLNIGNAHWVALYLDFRNGQRTPRIRYVDPLGGDIPREVVDEVQKIYPSINIKADIQVSTKKIQQDGYNCGPWTIAILESIVKTGQLPPNNFDIEQRRNEDTLIYRAVPISIPGEPQAAYTMSNPIVNEETFLGYLGDTNNKIFRETFDSLMAKELNALYRDNPGVSDKASEERLVQQARDYAFSQIKKLPQFKDQIDEIEAKLENTRIKHFR